MDEDRRDVDLDGADLAARATQGGREGQGVHRVVLGEALGELRGEDRADGARVDGAVGVTGGVLVDRADVHARAAADAGEGLAADRVTQDLGAAVVHEDEVEFLGAVAGGDARPHGGVGVHALTGRGAGQELGEDLHVLEAGDQLLDAHQGDERVGQGQAHAAVALGLEDGDGAGFCDAHVGAGHGDLGVQELLAQVGAGRGRQLGRVVGEVAGRVFHAIQEDAADFGAVAVDRGDDDVAGHVVGQLDDHLGEVGLASADALFLQVLVEVGLLGGHGLDLDDLVNALGLDDVRDDAVGLVLVARPVDDAAAGGHVAFEFLK